MIEKIIAVIVAIMCILFAAFVTCVVTLGVFFWPIVAICLIVLAYLAVTG